MVVIIPIIGWSGFGAMLGAAAAKRNGLEMANAICWGFVLGPLAFLLFGATDSTQLQCPACAEWVKAEAAVCRHCRYNLRRATEVNRQGTCRSCSGKVPAASKTCPNCESPIRIDHRLSSANQRC